MLFRFLFVMRFQLGTPAPRGTVSCATFPFRVGFRRFVSPPATMAVRGRVFTLVSRVVAPVFSFSRISLSRPPRHAGDPWEGFDAGLPYHSACVFLRLLFFAFSLAL